MLMKNFIKFYDLDVFLVFVDIFFAEIKFIRNLQSVISIQMNSVMTQKIVLLRSNCLKYKSFTIKIT